MGYGREAMGRKPFNVQSLLIAMSYEPWVAPVAEVRERGERAIRRDVISKEYGLSDRQAKAIGHIIEHGSLTIHGFESLCPDVNRRSLQRDLKAMVDQGLLLTEGETHRLLYRFA